MMSKIKIALGNLVALVCYIVFVDCVFLSAGMFTNQAVGIGLLSLVLATFVATTGSIHLKYMEKGGCSYFSAGSLNNLTKLFATKLFTSSCVVGILCIVLS